MRLTPRDLLKLWVALMLLWQGVAAAAAAHAGCCPTEQPCCVLPAAASACVACVAAALADSSIGRFTEGPAIQPLPAFGPVVGPEGAAHDIWRPPPAL